MDYLLAGTDIRLTYLQDHRALARIDWATLLDDLMDAGAPLNRLLWGDLDALTHVVLATDRSTGRCAGVLGLRERTTALEPWLLIDAIMVRPADAATLPLALLAHGLARIACLDGKPLAIAARRGDFGIEPVLRKLGDTVTGGAVHPPAASNVIGLRTAALARRVGVTFTVLDMRQVVETALLRDLRRLHRARLERARPRSAAAKVTGKVARIGGGMRRPKTTTHTDKSA